MPELTKRYGEYIYARDTIKNVGDVEIGNCAVSIMISPVTGGRGYEGPQKTYGRLDPGQSIRVAKGDVVLYVDKSIPAGKYEVYLFVRDVSVSPPWLKVFATGYTVNIVAKKEVAATGVVIE